jgi:hypothetical protein
MKEENYVVITFPPVGIMRIIFLKPSFYRHSPGETEEIHEKPESRQQWFWHGFERRNFQIHIRAVNPASTFFAHLC